MKNNFWGVGLRGGLDTQWGLGKGFSIYGKLALSVLWGKFSILSTLKLRTDCWNTYRCHEHQQQVPRLPSWLLTWLSTPHDTTFADDTWGCIWAWEHHYFSQNKLFKFVGTVEVFVRMMETSPHLASTLHELDFNPSARQW
jgi:hypothetical protein